MKTKIIHNFVLLSPIVFCIVFVILGLITPDYDPLKRTISRLSIERYGWIQQVNLLQFGLGLLLSGFLVAKTLTKEHSKIFIKRSSYLCAAFLTLAFVFPTNPIEPDRFNFSLLTPSGLIHVILVMIFVLISPFGVLRLSSIFESEKLYSGFEKTPSTSSGMNRTRYVMLKGVVGAFHKPLFKITKFWGLSSVCLSFILMIFIYFNMFPNYRGLFEKLIAIWVVIWLEIVNVKAIKNLKLQNKSSKDI